VDMALVTFREQFALERLAGLTRVCSKLMLLAASKTKTIFITSRFACLALRLDRECEVLAETVGHPAGASPPSRPERLGVIPD
jgi:hypothetical protein